MRTLDAVLGLGWLAFWLYWLAAAVGVKAGRSMWGRFGASRLVIAVVVIVLVRLHVFRGHMHDGAWLGGVGFAMFVLGLGLAIWARLHLGRNWGSPMSQKQDPELVTTGPYRWIRNPIYSGIILAMIGTALAVSVFWLIPVALLGGYFVYSAFVEQRFMASQFPDQYPAYQQSTKMLIPFVF
ncbi:MAG TPA: isoprenylcysteine carboxylmethyltransferase family protein [Mycobacteriales bacterium]|nr:isoprenylcysteine carboxylmethyltransferase family protein [Mycobacteriales bacterium]